MLCLPIVEYFVFCISCFISLLKSILRGTVFRSRSVFMYCFAINLFWLNYLINFWQQCEIGLEILITDYPERAIFINYVLQKKYFSVSCVLALVVHCTIGVLLYRDLCALIVLVACVKNVCISCVCVCLFVF